MRNLQAALVMSVALCLIGSAPVLGLDGISTDTTINQIYRALFNRNLEGAKQACDQALAKDSSNAAIAHISAFMQSEYEGSHEDALEVLDEALTAGATTDYVTAGYWGSVNLLVLKAELLARLDQTEQALEVFQAADSESAPLLADDLAKWAEVLLRHGKVDQSLAVLDKALDRSKVSVATNQLRLNIHTQQGRIPEAITDFRRFVFIDVLGDLFPSVTKLGQRSDELLLSYQSDGADEAFWDRLGDLFHRGGALSAAEIAYEKAGVQAREKLDAVQRLKTIIEELESIYHAHYESILHQRDDINGTYALVAAALAHWAEVHPPAGDTLSTKQYWEFITPIRKVLAEQERFYFVTAKTSGFDNIHYGFILSAEPIEVTHWGETGQFVHSVLSPIYGNGFGAWAVDNNSVYPGWNTRGSGLYHVLVASITDAIEVAEATENFLTHQSIREWWQQQTAYTPPKNTKWTDLAEGKKANLRLQVAEMTRFGQEAEAKDIDLVSHILRSKLQTSIIAHEGQHALDGGRGGSHSHGQPNLEYRAKLAELAYGAAPYSSLKGFVNSFRGSVLQNLMSHGKADQGVMKNLVEVLAEDDELNARLDRNIPLCLQLGKLTPEEITKLVNKVYEKYPDLQDQ